MAKQRQRHTKRPDVINMTYEDARRMSHDFTLSSRDYMASIIANHIPNGAVIADSSDLDYLRYCSHVIKGVADRFMKSYNKKMQKAEPIIQANINLLGKCKNLDEGALLEERICIQIEACGIPDNSKIVRNYELARDTYKDQFKGKQGYLF